MPPNPALLLVTVSTAVYKLVECVRVETSAYQNPSHRLTQKYFTFAK